jgi:hypothetical protein
MMRSALSYGPCYTNSHMRMPPCFQFLSPRHPQRHRTRKRRLMISSVHRGFPKIRKLLQKLLPANDCQSNTKVVNKLVGLMNITNGLKFLPEAAK